LRGCAPAAGALACHYSSLVRAALALGLVALALAVAPAAAADVFGAVQVRTADGALLASSRAGSFAYPADGSVVLVGSI
jgi:hypothetical protein